MQKATACLLWCVGNVRGDCYDCYARSVSKDPTDDRMKGSFNGVLHEGIAVLVTLDWQDTKDTFQTW